MMSNKMICPVCGKTELIRMFNPLTGEYFEDYDCPFRLCNFRGNKVAVDALIQAKQDLEQSEKCCSAWETQALDYKAETIALSGKLEIARKALKEIKKVCDGCRWCDSNLYDPTPSDGRRIAETTHKALTQIEHKD